MVYVKRPAFVLNYTEKRCKICCEVKSLTEFFPHKQNRDGRYGACAKCTVLARRTSNPKTALSEMVDAGYRPCTACGEVKSLAMFGKGAVTYKGVSPQCKACKRRQHAERTIDSLPERRRICWLEKPCKKCRQVKPLHDFVVKKSGSLDGRMGSCRACYLAHQKARLFADEKRLASKRADAIRRAAEAKKLPTHRLRVRLRRQMKRHDVYGDIASAVRRTVKGQRKAEALFDFLGYSADQLREHIERQFMKGMDWPKFAAGDIHIDHVLPVSSFDLSTDEEVRRCWSLPNLRPLWAKENMRKHASREFLL